MEGNKLEMSGKPVNDPPSSYKPIPETDMEEQAISRPKSLIKLKSISPEVDGADEKMLPKEDTKITPNSNIDMSEVKISPSEKQNGDAKLDIGELKSSFVGMGKEELMTYANDPFWVRLRWFLFITFWVLWAAMLVGAVLIIYAAPKCDPPPPRTWWQEGPLTEVTSDAKPEELKALKEKGIQGVIVSWLGDSYAKFNDSHEFIRLLQQAKKDGVNVIVELEPGTSSLWFENSEAQDSDVSDYYIWKAAKRSGNNGDNEPPNNWLSVKNESSWSFSSQRKEYYYSPNGKPHLNFRNENVTSEFSNVIKRFIDSGAVGIRIKNAASLLVDSKFENEAPNPKATDFMHTDHGFYTHSKTENLLELGTLLNKWRKVVKNNTENGPFMVAEHLYNPEAFKVNNSLVVDLPLESHLFSKPTVAVTDVVNSLNYTFNIDNIAWPLWKVNTSALPKDALDIVTYLLPGAPLIRANETMNEALLKIRSTPSIMRGSCSFHGLGNDSVFAYIRVTSGNPGILVALNPLTERMVVNFPKEIPALSQLQEVTIQMYSNNYNETDFMDINAKKDATAVPISPHSVVVLSYVPKKKQE